MRLILYILLLILYALHNDLWLWDDGSLVLACRQGSSTTSATAWPPPPSSCCWFNFAWPRHLSESEGGEESEDSRP